MAWRLEGQEGWSVDPLAYVLFSLLAAVCGFEGNEISDDSALFAPV
jgi:hypothetical protein